MNSSSLTTDFRASAASKSEAQDSKKSQRITLAHIGREPYRAFFPAGLLAGIVGVALWPFYFLGIMDFYPGQTHPRIMAFGLFGGFILGFLGTAMPRMLSANPFGVAEVIPLLLLHIGMVVSFAAGKLFLGDVLFLVLLTGFFACMAIRIPQRKDIPPPGFVLVGLAFICVTAGAALAIVQNFQDETETCWVLLQRLLCYQGFVLLPILGIGPFILPRFFGMPNPHEFPEAIIPPAGWTKKAAIALTAGLLIIVSFIIEANGWLRTACAVRFLTTLTYFYLEMPFHRTPKVGSALGFSVRAALFCVVAGFLAVVLFPAHRTNLLHLTLIGGFAIMALVVATRVVFGHSGSLDLLKRRNRWLFTAIGLMLFGMATRMSGDFWTHVRQSHYIYGTILWIGGALLWSAYVLPKVLIRDVDE